MSGLNSALWIVGSYIVIIILIFVIINFLTRGFLNQYIKVKTSRGKLILVKCYDVTDNFYKAGRIDHNRNLIVKDRQKKIHTFSKINRSYVGTELGVNIIEVNLVEGLIIKRDFSSTTSYDLTIVDELVNRAIMLPKLSGESLWEKIQKIFFVIIIVGIGVIIFLLVTQEPICNVAPLIGGNI